MIYLRVKRLEQGITLGLTRRVFSVYFQLTKKEKSNAAWIKDELCTAFVTVSRHMSKIWSTYFTPIRNCWCLFDRFFKRCQTVQWCAFPYMVYLALWRDTCNHRPEWTHCLLKSRRPEPGQLWKALMEELVIAAAGLTQSKQHGLHLESWLFFSYHDQCWETLLQESDARLTHWCELYSWIYIFIVHINPS